MVTDEEFRGLHQRVDILEKKILDISRRYNEMLMRQDMQVSKVKSFPITSTRKRDTTQYIFLGNKYCKRRLVLACVKQFVLDHPGISFEKLQQIYPDYIQGSLGIIRKAEDAEKYNRAKQRFFFADSDVIILENTIYVVCSQWDQRSILRFIMLEKALGYHIDDIKKLY